MDHLEARLLRSQALMLQFYQQILLTILACATDRVNEEAARLVQRSTMTLSRLYALLSADNFGLSDWRSRGLLLRLSNRLTFVERNMLLFQHDASLSNLSLCGEYLSLLNRALHALNRSFLASIMTSRRATRHR